ncbi:mechanosensitive ion channel protein 6-like [Bidens hawaiensis]|uniref:mechanosensitive ion channel protein 6-like n=1 Tax=Bidens hawaiensis TaxID=980011 RepID=UPI00404AA5CC
MDRSTTSTNNSLNEVLIKVKDDAPSQTHAYCPLLDHVSNVKRKRGPKQDYAWFKEDDFNIDCIIEDTSNLKQNCYLQITQWVLLLLLLALFICSLSISRLKQLEMWDVAVWKWELLVLVIICGRLIANLVVEVIVSLVESKFHLKIGVLYVVYGIRKSIRNLIWLSLFVIASHFVVARKNHIRHFFTKVTVCLIVGALVWLLKTIIVKVLAASFHLIAFFRRIKVSLYKQYVIKKLGGDLVKGRDREEACGHTKLSSWVLGKKKVTALKVRRMIETVQAGDLPRLSIVDEDLPVRSDEEEEDECSLRAQYRKVTNDAREIYLSVTQQSKYITIGDLEDRLGKEKVSKAKELFVGSIREVHITEDGFKHWMKEAYTERRTLALSVNDTKTAVDDLHRIMDVTVVIMIAIIWLIICGVPVTHFLIFVTTQLALGAYVIGNTGKGVFESIVFLFIMHPYDVGDRCEVDGKQLTVDEMTMLTTVFMRSDNQKVIYPNSVLATKSIGNFSRSPAMDDEIEFSINISTPRDKIEEIKKQIKKYISNKSDYWFDDPTIVVKGVDDMNTLKMVVWPTHVVNHHYMSQRWERRSELILEMIKVFKDLEIDFRLPALSVNIDNIEGVRKF